MDRSIKIAGWVLIAIVALWFIFQVVSVVFSFLTWIVSVFITLATVGVILFAAYYLITKMVGGGSPGGSSTRERERIYE